MEHPKAKNARSFSFRKCTFPLRLGIVKLLTPQIVEAAEQFGLQLNSTPRPMIAYAKQHFTHSLIGAEIGVATGVNALSILQELPIDKLYLIDPYLSYVENERFRDSTEWFGVAKKRLKHYSNITWLKSSSSEAVAKIKEQLDFVYIDGNHSYENVSEDLLHYYHIIKPNGIIGGHDYCFHYAGLMCAVKDFVKKNELQLNVIFPDYWIIKPSG